MRFELLYPEGKKKCCTFSYDDAQIHDRRLVEIFNQYGLKATFHINSGRLDKEGYVTEQELTELYLGHEVACHGINHPYFTYLTRECLVDEILQDRRALEGIMKYPVRGMSYPFGVYSEEVCTTAKQLGVEYSRTVEDTNNFFLPTDFLCWHPTCHHNKVTPGLIESFLNPPGYMRIPLFYIWGHSFEFEWQNTWDKFEEICKRLSHDAGTWYATNIQIKDYLCAGRGLVCSVDQSMIFNPSAIPVWIKVAGEVMKIEPLETKVIQ